MTSRDTKAGVQGTTRHGSQMSLPNDGDAASRFATLSEPDIFVGLSHDNLDIKYILEKVKRPDAGASVIFTGTTRDNFQGRQVVHLSYSAYQPLALKHMLQIAKEMKQKHHLNAIAILHRLGDVPVGVESIFIAVSTPHRKAAWLAGEETLELVKAKVEIWKYEKFEDGGAWRANRDGACGQPVENS